MYCPRAELDDWYTAFFQNEDHSHMLKSIDNTLQAPGFSEAAQQIMVEALQEEQRKKRGAGIRG